MYNILTSKSFHYFIITSCCGDNKNVLFYLLYEAIQIRYCSAREIFLLSNRNEKKIVLLHLKNSGLLVFNRFIEIVKVLSIYYWLLNSFVLYVFSNIAISIINESSHLLKYWSHFWSFNFTQKKVKMIIKILFSSYYEDNLLNYYVILLLLNLL